MIVTVAASLMGFALIAHGVRFWIKGRASVAWPEATARRSTGLVLKDESGDVTMYRPKVRYEYSYEGVHYEGNTAFFGDRLWMPISGHLWGRVNVIEGQDQFPVRVNPRHPSESVVEPGVHWHAYAAGLFGVGFLVWALVAML